MIVIGDIHGNFDTLIALLATIPDEEKAKGICLVGDLIDRGPKSKQVIQWVIDQQKAGNKVFCVMGNHEDLMINNALSMAEYFIENGGYHYGRLSTPNLWMVNGGDKAFDSYIEEQPDGSAIFDHKTLKEHVEFLKTLPLYMEFKDVKNDKGESLLVTHSSACRVWEWNETRRNEQSKIFRDHIIWGRPNTINSIPNVFNIFGHTPVHNGPKLKSCYANVDTGCFYNGQPGYFQLTALQFPEMKVYQHECIDKPVYGDEE